ncbi:glycosyltransferase family 2 protein [Loktanella sp. 5RATIMAR09]|uniref:glycosyltransferase family 2 protein n=1 Tax=Loktanella sp. 5RATIMAR09 TaxID=1225655 RepID=UPI0009F987E4|nr:glycosyltransferase family 2 protein [Loktanella sp. 5RATIMAR09]
MTGSVTQCRLGAQDFGRVRLLDVVGETIGSRHFLSLFFDRKIDPEVVQVPQGVALVKSYAIVGAHVFCFEVPSLTAPLPCMIAAHPVTILPVGNEQHHFTNANVLLAVRNGESVQVVLDWLQYHVRVHGMTGAVILDRDRPHLSARFATNLDRRLKDENIDVKIMILTANEGLGQPDLPPESDPYCVPDAPGKDRMTVPPADLWRAPLGAIIWYEIARVRFLARARAVANLDVYDLAAPDGVSIFDAAVAAQGGIIRLLGRQCYPWRIRQGDPIRFADHTCVQFDASRLRKRWCIAPEQAPKDVVWKMVRVANAPSTTAQDREFYRHMALRHPTDKVSLIVPKSGLVEHKPLLEQAKQHFGHKPVRMPKVSTTSVTQGRGRCTIVTTMKNEGPFILEWLAYHRAIGFDDFLIYTNDCTDGTDTMLDLLAQKGLVQHRDNDFRKMNLRPQHAALQMAEDEPLIKDAKWVACIDVDEFVNIKVGDGTLDALFGAVPDANMISMTWRLFGNADTHAFSDAPVLEQFTCCAPEVARKPHQAWGFKTLFQNIGIFKKLGVHRPKGLNPQLWEDIRWVNGSGNPLPHSIYRNGWRSTTQTYGYDLVQLNHYAVRSAESFLVKRDRGRVNHVDRDQGLSYWFRMNNNFEEDRSIQRHLPKMHAELASLLCDPDIAAAHQNSVTSHRAKIRELRARDDYDRFYRALTGSRLERLSRLHSHFGANVFLSGPDVIPDDIVTRDPHAEWSFTVDRPENSNH